MMDARSIERRRRWLALLDHEMAVLSKVEAGQGSPEATAKQLGLDVPAT
jgi:hypothetical protein